MKYQGEKGGDLKKNATLAHKRFLGEKGELQRKTFWVGGSNTAVIGGGQEGGMLKGNVINQKDLVWPNSEKSKDHTKLEKNSGRV